MKKKNKLFTLIILIAFTFTLHSCFISGAIAKSHAKSEYTEEFNAIPPEFGQKHTIFLITLRKRSSYNKYLKNASKKYLGECILINKGDEELEKYSDKSVYRFLFDYSDGSTSSVYYSDGLESSVTGKRFYVKDRLKDKIYNSGFETAFFGKALKAYMENLELKRISMK